MESGIFVPVAVAGVALGVSLIAAFAEHRQRHRTDLDRIGALPWRGIAFWSSALVILAGGAALRAWAGGA